MSKKTIIITVAAIVVIVGAIILFQNIGQQGQGKLGSEILTRQAVTTKDTKTKDKTDKKISDERLLDEKALSETDDTARIIQPTDAERIIQPTDTAAKEDLTSKELTEKIKRVKPTKERTPTAPAPTCGDGNVDAGEQCDDGNTTGGDGCSSTCMTETPALVPAPLTIPTVAKVTTSSLLGNGDMSLYKMTVTAGNQRDLSLKQITFNVDATTTLAATLSNYRLLIDGIDVTALTSLDIVQLSGGLDCELAVACNTADSQTILVQWDDGINESEFIISAGDTVTYELIATTAGILSNEKITTTLLNDTNGYAGKIDDNDANNQIDIGGAAQNTNFVWSDLHVSPHSSILGESSPDWYDGATTPGLSTAGYNELSS